MQSRGSSSRLTGSVRTSRISSPILAMLAMMSTIFVAGRLWQDAENRVHLIKELDRRTGQGNLAISVDDTWKIIACKDQKKKLMTLEAELAAARKEGFVAKYTPNMTETYHKRRAFLVVGIATEISHKKNRDAIRRSWMPTGAALRKMEEDRGIIIRFFVAKCPHHQGNATDLAIDEENAKTNDFIILDEYIEDSAGLPRKTKSFFAQAADNWDAEFYAKVNDDVFVNLDGLVSTLRTHQHDPRVYIGCMKSGEVFTEQSQKWYEPEWWRFGDGKSYFRHAAGQMFVLSRALAQFVSINKCHMCNSVIFVEKGEVYTDLEQWSFFKTLGLCGHCQLIATSRIFQLDHPSEAQFTSRNYKIQVLTCFTEAERYFPRDGFSS